MADNFPPLVCLSTLHIDCNALPLIRKGLMKYLPSGDTLVKIHSHNDKAINYNSDQIPSLKETISITTQYRKKT